MDAVFLRSRYSSTIRHPNHGTTIAAQSHSIVRSTPTTRWGLLDAVGGLLPAPSRASGVGASTGGTSEPLDASDTSAASRSATRFAFEGRLRMAGLMTQARQPARMRLYCDLATNRDDGSMIWNHC